MFLPVAPFAASKSAPVILTPASTSGIITSNIFARVGTASVNPNNQQLTVLKIDLLPDTTTTTPVGFEIGVVPDTGFSYPASTQQQEQTGKINSRLKITYRLIPGINNTWGYDIYVGNKLLIHQPSCPALPGNEGFKTKHQSVVVAKIVIKKLKKGIMPPSISVDDLQKAKII